MPEAATQTPAPPEQAGRSRYDKQRHRFRRYLMAVGSSLLVLVIMFALRQSGMMDPVGFLQTSFLLLLSVALFGILFATGLNLRAQDPSLTSGQMACSMLVLSMAMFYSDSDGRGLLLMIFLVSFIFGVLRLQVRELLSSGLIASLLYAAVVMLLMLERPAGVNVALEFKRWLIMSFVLVWFSMIGGHISRVRKQLSDNNVELEKALRTIQELATHDALTGLHNRRYLEDILSHECSQSRRSKSSLCLCIVDLDWFKSINDTYGHHCGDEVLRGFAAAAAEMVRQSDHFGRYGGEEFLGVLTGTDVAGAKIWAERLRQKTETLTFPGLPESFRTSVSIGVACFREGEDIGRAVLRADDALYRAKAAGRNRVMTDDAPASPASVAG